MSLNLLTKKQLKASIKGVIIFYIIVLSTSLIGFEMRIDSTRINITEGLSAIFLLMIGATSYEKYFKLALQSNLSRKRFLYSTLLYGGILSLVMATYNVLFSNIVFGLIDNPVLNYDYNSLTSFLFGDINAALAIFWLSLVYITFFLLGLAIICFIYKARKGVKYTILTIIILGITGHINFSGRFVAFVGNSLNSTLFNPTIGTSIGNFACLALLLFIFTYILLQRIELSNNESTF